jgi:hypothetical protein
MENNDQSFFSGNFKSTRNIWGLPLFLFIIVFLIQSCTVEHAWKGGTCDNNKGIVGIRYDFAR